MANHEILTVQTRGGQLKTVVYKGGTGKPLVWLHGSLGVSGWEPQLQALSAHFTVYAPVQPGVGRSEGLEQLDDLWDLTLSYLDLFDALGLDQVALVGHSYGGMVAAEIAAMAPNRVSHLVLVDALGLWRDDAPVLDFWVASQAEQAKAMYHDPNGMIARMIASAMPTEEKARNEAIVSMIINNGATLGKFAWPIPDKGLKKRIHRITSPTLLIWGKSDGIVPPIYAETFAERIPDARVELIDNAGHLPHLERMDRFAPLVTEFCK
jgi:pimeloyl-ACP methyl ester carboxylesterase